MIQHMQDILWYTSVAGAMGSMEPLFWRAAFQNTMCKHTMPTLLPLQLGMAMYHQYESAYFPVPYADNQLFFSLCGLKQSHAFNSAGFKHNN